MAQPLRLVFAGTPEFALPCLRAAAHGGAIAAVYTQPDRPAGRGRRLAISPVKRQALEYGLEVRQPHTLTSAQIHDTLRALAPDLMIVVAYGLILPKVVLAIPKHGCWNLHASLLPRWRGAAPIQRAIEAGDAHTGVCLMQMTAGLDTGPVLLSKATPIAADDTGGSVHDRLAALGAELLSDGLTLLRAGMRPVPRPQPDAGVTYAHKLSKAEARLDWAQPAEALARKVRAFDPWPIAEADVDGERLRVWRAEARQRTEQAEPGRVLKADREGIDVACGDGMLRITVLQRAGGQPITAADYVNARSRPRGFR